MRKLSLLAAMAAVLGFGSCSGDQEIDNNQAKNEGREINFRSVIDKGSASRATVTDDNNILGFTVTGWWDKTNTEEAGVGDPKEGGYLFNAVDITRRESGIYKWDYDPKLYWPSNGYGVYFYAYSPASTENVTGEGKGLYNYAGEVLEYAVPDPGEYESQEDFLMAKKAVLDKQGTVNLAFAHVLSRVTFSAKKNENIEGVTYLIKGVELINIKKAGTIKYADIPESGSFTYDENGLPITFWDTSSSSVEKLAVNLGNSPIYVQSGSYESILGKTGALMVMPQTTELAADPNKDATEFMVKVTYKAFIDPEDPGTYYAGAPDSWKDAYFAVTDAQRSEEKDPQPFSFEIGRQYNFYLTFGSEVGGSIRFDVKVGDWDNTAPQIELPQINDYYAAGLISETLAAIANPDYQTEGVSLGDMLRFSGNEGITINNAKTEDFEGLNYFQNLKKLTIHGTASPIDLNLSGLNLTELRTEYNPVFSTLDLSGISNKLVIEIPYYVSGGTQYDSVLTINDLILWDNYETGTEGNYLAKSNRHSYEKRGFIEVGAINGDTGAKIDKTDVNQFWTVAD